VATVGLWIALALTCSLVVCLRFGKMSGVSWIGGWMIEMIFTMENVCVFNVLARGLKAKSSQMMKAFTFVIYCQLVFEGIFLMGLAVWFRSFHAMPYLLGIWLIVVGFYAATEGEDASDSSHHAGESRVSKLMQQLVGERLLMRYDTHAALFIEQNGVICVTMLAPLVCCLVAADFWLEVDTCLTKIQEIPDAYISYTSSVAASFTVPHLFVFMEELLSRFFLVKYGIGLSLAVFGVSMLLHNTIYVSVTALCFIVVILLVLCVAISAVLNRAALCLNQWQAPAGSKLMDTHKEVESKAQPGKDAPKQ